MNSQLSNSLDAVLPPLDLHAHIDPTVTATQLASLGTALVFAVTRTLDEATTVRQRADSNLVWGIGVHPGIPNEIEAFDPTRFSQLLGDFSFVGEVGLDRKVPAAAGTPVLHEILQATQAARRLCSLHSTGRQGAVLDAIGPQGQGMVLHWFTGSSRQIQQAAEAGAYFSVNAAMSDAQIGALPPERLLPETDFPFSKKAGSKRPGDIEVLERRTAQLLALSRDHVRTMWYRNLRDLCMSAGALGSLPPAIARPVLAA